MRPKDKILTEISKIKHSIELGCSTTETAHRVGMVDGMYYAIEDDKTDPQDDNTVTVNIRYELDKEAYRQYVADMKDIEAEFKADSPVFVGVAGEDLECGDAVFKNTDGKLYKSKLEIDHIDYDNTTDHISATLKDVCRWWISKYKRNSTFDEYTIESNIAENMEYLMKRRGW
jgi:hypothetical protein